MPTYQIAGLTVHMVPQQKTLLRQSAAYAYPEVAHPDIRIELAQEFLEEKQRKFPELTPDGCEYLWMGFSFYQKLLKFDGFVLHASAIAYGGRAYVFSAPCGTGKSTHAGLWRKSFGTDNVTILNDDKPALRLQNGVFYAYGTPFSGKTDQSVNLGVPIAGICVLEQAPENTILRMTGRDAILPIFHQTLRPPDETNMDLLLNLIERLVKTVPIYKMGCTISEDAARLAYETMRRG